MENIVCELYKCTLNVGFVEAITEVRRVRRRWYWVHMSAKCNSKNNIYACVCIYIFIRRESESKVPYFIAAK